MHAPYKQSKRAKEESGAQHLSKANKYQSTCYQNVNTVFSNGLSVPNGRYVGITPLQPTHTNKHHSRVAVIRPMELDLKCIKTTDMNKTYGIGPIHEVGIRPTDT